MAGTQDASIGSRFDTVVGDEIRSSWFSGDGKAVEVAPRTWFVDAPFTNATFFETDEGLVLVDTGVFVDGPVIHAAAREVTSAPLHTAVYTHGHIDHAFGLKAWLDAGERPRVIAHRNVPRRFRRYMRTAPYNALINAIQMQIDNLGWPSEPGDFVWPDTTYDDALTISLGGETFELHHGKGETDDATWVWAPERKVLCSGDFWMSCAPNCGNPQKVQRWPEEWADTAERLASLGAEVLCPGHGPVVRGAQLIAEGFLDQVAYLRAIVSRTIDGLNAGLATDEIVAGVRVPAELEGKRYLHPSYDRPEFVARNVIRRHGGWWDRYPANLLPAPQREQAAAIVELAGGPEAVAAKAREAAADGRLELACHLAEWAALGAPGSREAQEARRDVFMQRLEGEPSLMARAIFQLAANEATRALEGMA